MHEKLSSTGKDEKEDFILKVGKQQAIMCLLLKIMSELSKVAEIAIM